MRAEKREAIRIDYPKHWFLMGAAMWAVATSLLFYFAETAPTDATRNLWLVIAAVEGVLRFLFFVPPLFTYHLAGEKSLRIKMGLLIDATLPYSWVKEVKQTSVNWGGVRVGIGVRYNSVSKTLWATTEFSNLVSLRLDGTHRFGRLMRSHPEQIVLSVDLPVRLIGLVKEKAGLPEDI